MSIFSTIFGGGATKPEPAPVAAATSVTSAPAPAPAPVEPPAPLDTFSKLWDAPSTPKPIDATRPGNIFAGADPTKMLEAARGVDFSRSIDPALLTQIEAGGPEAAKAMLAIANNIGQQAYAQSAFAATQMIERALGKYDEGANSRLPSTLKRLNASEAVQTSNPALNHKAVAPVVRLLEAKFAEQFPQATAAQIKDYTVQYLTEFSQIMVDPNSKSAKGSGNGGSLSVQQDTEDWGEFFSPQTR